MTAVAREPWEMTREEYREAGKRLYDQLGSRAYVNSNFHKSSEDVPHELFLESQQRCPNNSSNQAHYRVIRQALKEGKPVPVEVLKDYPELVKPEDEAKTGYTLEDYNGDIARSRKAYREILRRTGSHTEAFKAENEIASDALRKYEAINPSRMEIEYLPVLAKKSKRKSEPRRHSSVSARVKGLRR